MKWLMAFVPAKTKINWALLWMNVGWIDVVFVVVFTVGVVIGLKKGIGKILALFFGVFLAQVATIEYKDSLAASASKLIPAIPKFVLEAGIFIFVAAACLLTVSLLAKILSLIGKIEFKSFVKNVGGGLMGGGLAILILSLVTTFVLILPVSSVRASIREGSLSGIYLEAVPVKIHGLLRGLIPGKLRAR